MRVLIAGIDGYLGWPLAQRLAAEGCIVGGIDRFLRRDWVSEVGGISAIPVSEWPERANAYRTAFGAELWFARGDMQDYDFVRDSLTQFRPDAIVHLAEMPSAPYSMLDAAHAAFTQQNNVIGSLNLLWAMRDTAPDAHLIKLGTMGEYGTPDLDIPEGFFEVEFRGRRDRLPFPRQAGSFYHWSKVHDSNNMMFACAIWGLHATDVMQGVVYGTRVGLDSVPATLKTSQHLMTRLDFDPFFGTAINRFVCQAVIGHALTLYGTGAQQRGFIPLRDSIECIVLAIRNSPVAGEYRVLNQFERTYSIVELAELVRDAAADRGLDVDIASFENPRLEKQQHYYNPDRNALVALGYVPRGEIRAEIGQMLDDVLQHRARIFPYRHRLLPTVRWDGGRRALSSIGPE
jgi:UDP-sulfoquinovose synthase